MDAQRTQEDTGKHNPYFPFRSLRQTELVVNATFPKILSNREIGTWCTQRAIWLQEDAFPSVKSVLMTLDCIAALQSPWIYTTLNSPTAFWCRNSLEVLKDILEDESLGNDFVWAPCKSFDQDGNRVYSEMWTANWWWRMQKELHPNQRIPANGSTTVIPIILSYDKTLFGTMSGTQSGWPVYMTIGNIPMSKRWLPSKPFSRCIAMLPKIEGQLCSSCAECSETGKSKRMIVQRCLGKVLQPLMEVMDGGFSVTCGDSVTCLCFPCFAQYVADYEEQRMLTGILSGGAPNVFSPHTNLSKKADFN